MSKKTISDKLDASNTQNQLTSIKIENDTLIAELLIASK